MLFPVHFAKKGIQFWYSDPGMHHGTCVTHVPWCMSGSLIWSTQGRELSVWDFIICFSNRCETRKCWITNFYATRLLYTCPWGHLELNISTWSYVYNTIRFCYFVWVPTECHIQMFLCGCVLNIWIWIHIQFELHCRYICMMQPHYLPWLTWASNSLRVYTIW